MADEENKSSVKIETNIGKVVSDEITNETEDAEEHTIVIDTGKKEVNLEFVQKSPDITIFLTNGGSNSTWMIRKMLMEESIRNTMIYVMYIINNPYKEKYIQKQLEFLRNCYTNLSITYFRIEDLPEEYKTMTMNQIIEKYANNAILKFFDPFMASGSIVDIYIASNMNNYVELKFDDKFKDHVHYPLKEDGEFIGMEQLFNNYPELYFLVRDCDNMTEEKEWCGNCYDCLATKHLFNSTNTLFIDGVIAMYAREKMKEWFGIDLPKNRDELNAQTLSAGCGCAECNPDNPDAYTFQDNKGFKKIVPQSKILKMQAELIKKLGVDFSDAQDSEDEEDNN